jgi:hypothetical protein
MESPYERLAKGLKLSLQHDLLNCGYTWLDGVGIAPAALCEGIFYSHRLQSFSHMRYLAASIWLLSSLESFVLNILKASKKLTKIYTYK